VMNWSARFVPPAGASLSIGYAKLAIVKGSSFPLEAGMLLERHLQEQLFRSHDGPEGMKAYLEKRSAVFTGE
jgi:enoyl-CoA hydratase